MARVIVDGRYPNISGGETGNFIRPTVLGNINPEGEIAKTEIFGPVLGLIHVDTIDDAIQLINSGQYGNMACLFTSSGASARKFRYEAQIGKTSVINIGVCCFYRSAFFSRLVVGRTAFSGICMDKKLGCCRFFHTEEGGCGEMELGHIVGSLQICFK